MKLNEKRRIFTSRHLVIKNPEVDFFYFNVSELQEQGLSYDSRYT